MYLKKLELVGFKSFCDKTILHFEPGVTAVVGPNGCGKSNIFDSIRWVLGEQSIKSLRGSEMQDVIFNGTDTKQPLSMAEVTLAFDNASRFFKVEDEEVVITRRIFRSGESEYLLNKNQVRLKDILDILMGTGVGAESYSLVAQGKIDLVLSSRPEDRRLVFDEASGVTKYKAQKRETLRKLEETSQNLLRVNDIINEVKRQIGSLERQANKARRYKELFEELKSRETSFAVLKRSILKKETEEIIKELGIARLKEKELADLIKEEETKIANRQAELKIFEDRIMAVKNQLLGLNNLVENSKERINFNSEKRKELNSSKQYLAGQLEQARAKLVLDEEKLGKLKKEYADIEGNIRKKNTILAEKEDELNKVTASLKLATENISRMKIKILDLTARSANIRNEITDLNSKGQIYLARKKRLEIELAKAKEEKAQVESSLQIVTGEVENLESLLNDLGSKVAALKQDADQEASFLDSLNKRIEDSERQILTLESQKEFVQRLKTKYEDISESMNAVVYLDRLPANKLTGLVVKIKDCQVLSDEDKSYLDPANLKLSGEAKPMDLDTANIDLKISQIKEELAILNNEKTVKAGRIEELQGLHLGLQGELHSHELSLINKKAVRQTILAQCDKIKEEEELVSLELTDVDRETLIIKEKAAQGQIRLLTLEEEQRESEAFISSEGESINTNNGLKEQLLVALAQTKAESEALNKRITQDETTLKIIEGTYAQDKESLSNFESQLKDNASKEEALLSEIRDLENASGQRIEEIKAQTAALNEAEGQYQAVSGGPVEMAKKVEVIRQQFDELREKAYQLEMQNKDLEFKQAGLKERILQAYKVDLDSLPLPCPDNQEVKEDTNTLAQEIAALKGKLESYGTVNLVAIEEYDELKKRYDFLIQQQTDLTCAKESLHEAILKINRTTKKMFLETFQRVREEFRNYFRLLFNGGDAQLFLIDEEDPLESGIEIICRPPGKKLQNVLLLSGGEKSMSAIALIFAIFKVKPSPFCILDEIDAALDEANVDRFGRILQEFTKESQFIVITHNKKTIANANVMYGITMEESGVSRIVSVKFAEDKRVEEKEKEKETEAVAEPV